MGQHKCHQTMQISTTTINTERETPPERRHTLRVRSVVIFGIVRTLLVLAAQISLIDITGGHGGVALASIPQSRTDQSFQQSSILQRIRRWGILHGPEVTVTVRHPEQSSRLWGGNESSAASSSSMSSSVPITSTTTTAATTTPASSEASLTTTAELESSSSSSSPSSHRATKQTKSLPSLPTIPSPVATSVTEQRHPYWWDLDSLQPNLRFGIQTRGPPLPHWAPAWKSFQLNLGCYHDNDRSNAHRTTTQPSPASPVQQQQPKLHITASEAATHMQYYWEAIGRFALPLELELLVRPIHTVPRGLTKIFVELTRGTSNVLTTTFYHRGKQGRVTNHHHLESIQASHSWRLPFATFSSLRISPAIWWSHPMSDTIDPCSTSPKSRSESSLYNTLAAATPRKQTNETVFAACTLEMVSGGAGRTTATLRLERERPTFAIRYNLRNRHVIIPEINLFDASVRYQWTYNTPRGNQLQTMVDPHSAIHVRWIDHSLGGGGRWITDVRLPLDVVDGDPETAPCHIGRKGCVAAEFHVRRQFLF